MLVYLLALSVVGISAKAQDLILWADSLSPYLTTNSFSPTDCAVSSGLAAAGTRKLLRFGTEARNIGMTDFALGSPSGNTNFTWAACHGHYHVRNFLVARLKTTAGSIIASADPGLCLSDSEPLDLFSPPVPMYDCDTQGLQRGWRCTHTADLDGQWIDVTGLPAGDYTLEVEINGRRAAGETSYANNTASVPVTLPRCFALTTTNLPAIELKGNGNGYIDPGETVTERIVLTVNGCAVTNAMVQLSSASPGITMVNSTSAFPVAVEGLPVTNAVPLTYRLAKTAICGATLPMRAVLTAGDLVTTSTWVRRVGSVTILGAATNVYQSTDVPKRIYDMTTSYSTNLINVAGTNVIDDVDLLLRINHSFVGDLALGLQHPDGTEAVVFYHSGDSDQNFGFGTKCNNAQYTVLDDEAPEWILNAISPYLGSYRPYLPLSAMDGKPLNGAWRLRMTDITAGDVGTNLCWSLRIAYHREQTSCSLFSTAPTAVSFSVTAPDAMPASLALRGQDDDGDLVTFIIAAPPAHGTLSDFVPTAGTLAYLPSGGYAGPDTITYRVSDGATTSGAATVSITVEAADSDADGLPNGWESRYFGSATGASPAADGDLDGYANIDEWIMDTNPTNGASRLYVIALSNAVGRLVYFPSSTARVYRLWGSAVPDSAWSNLTGELTGSGGTMALGDTNTPPAFFYRIGVRIP